jgi:tetratricopeptide (TPR) repeat protein
MKTVSTLPGRASPVLAALVLAALSGCGTPKTESAATAAAPSDRFHLGSHAYRVTTASPDAQRAFDRGLTLAYAFSYQRAEREFRNAAGLDSTCAMAWWGIALVNGPHINFPLVPPDRAKKAWEALGRARAAAGGAGPTEKALIDALSKRYADPQPEDRAPLDQAYADAMRAVWKAHPEDADVGVLTAEALMDLHPWDLWKQDGTAQPWTGEILGILERALVLDPDHPGGNHLYIHAVEASPEPAKALPAADRLGGLVPGAGHLVHMPAHIYARLGRWGDAAAANVRAIEADSAYRAEFPRPGFYAMYMAHDHHFLAFTAMMEGRSGEAIRVAREMVAGVPEDFLAEYTVIADGFMVFVPEVLMRFGRWEEVLAEPEPRKDLPLARALWHYTRTASLTALGRMDEAVREREAFLAASARVPKESFFGNNASADILAIASLVLDGEMAARRERFDEAISSLRRAVALEDALRYDEPPDWIQPVRHTLGAVLLRAGKYPEAEAVYREDLAKYPENGWSLFGLGRALRLAKKDEAGAVEARFAKAWAKADVTLESTCYCQPGI